MTTWRLLRCRIRCGRCVHDFALSLTCSGCVCVGTNPVRPQNKLQEIGLLNDGAPLVADAQGKATGEFDDSQIRLEGVNSSASRLPSSAAVPCCCPRSVPHAPFRAFALCSLAQSLAAPW